MAYSISAAITLGTGDTGLTLEAQIIDEAGVNVGSAITTGFFEVGLGMYLWDGSIADAQRGAIVFQDSPGGTKRAIESLNPDQKETARVVWQRVLSTVGGSSLTAEKIMRLLDATQGGKISGVGTGTVKIRNSEDSKDVVTASVDGTGNRITITLDLS